MRRSTAFSLVVIFALAGTDIVRADDAVANEQFRNPIEWLFNDINKLLTTATLHLTKATHSEPKPQSDNKAEPVAAKIDTASSPSKVAEEDALQSVTATSTEPTTFRNPISWLFRDLAEIFQPVLSIDQNKVVDTEASPIKTTVQDATETASKPEPINIVAETSVAAEPEAPASDAVAYKNPITWIFEDLANLLAPAEDNQEPAVAETTDGAQRSAATTVASPVLVDTALLAQSSTVTPKAEMSTDIVIMAENADIAFSEQPLAVAPWIPRPESDLFDPSDSLFAADGTPLLATLPAPSALAVEDEAIAMDADHNVTIAAIRQRPEHRPAARNHKTLGRDHKAVTPDPIEDSLLDQVLENLFGIETPLDAEEAIANKVSDRIVPEEKLDLEYTSPDVAITNHELKQIGDGPLTDLDLIIGRDLTIGSPYDPSNLKAESCIERALHGSVFCLVDMNWPAQIASSFATDTAFVLPGEGVVRYENGVASQVYAVFNATEFADVVKFMQHRFGPPQQREIGWMHMLEAPRLPNTTFRWQAFSADRRDAIVLEVRNFDDLRRSFADMDHGMVQLYRIGSRPVFKHISTMDLMLLQRRRVARAPVTVNEPPVQR